MLPPGSHLPFGVVGDSNGNIIVVDYLTSSLYRFDWAGNAIGDPVRRCANDPFPGGFSGPYRVALAPNTSVTLGSPSGTVFIVDTLNNRVVMCDGSMNFVGHFGNDPANTDPTVSPIFSGPTAVAVDPVNRLLYVASPNGQPRVLVFDWNAPLRLGTAPIWTISNQPPAANRTSVPEMGYPFGVAVDANHRLLVADEGSNKMFVFDDYAKLPRLNPLRVSIGTSSAVTQDTTPVPPPGPPGQLANPANITLDSTGRLMIADNYNMRVQRFQHPVMTATVTPPAHVAQINQPLVLNVAVQAASGTFTAVQLEYTPHDSNLGTPVVAPVVAGGDTVIAGNGATNFTMTFTPSAKGTYAFAVWATGIPATGGPRVGSSDGAGTTEPIAVGATGDLPTITATITSASPAVSVTSSCGTLTGCIVTQWYVTPPFVHVDATGTPVPNAIDYLIQVDKPTTSSVYKACLPVALSNGHLTCSAPVVKDGLNHVWYRAKSVTTDVPPVTLTADWKDQRVYYDANAPIVLSNGTTPPANESGWNNSSFNANYNLLPGAVGWPENPDGSSKVPNGGVVKVCRVGDASAACTGVTAQTDSASFFVPVPKYTDAAGRTTEEQGPVQLGPFSLDSHAPTVGSAPVITPPAGVVLNANSFYDLTGKTPDVGVTVSLTAADAAPSSTFQVFYATSAGNPTCLPTGPTCMLATFDSVTGTYQTTILNTLTTGVIWALDLAGNASAVRPFSVKITRNTPSANAQSISTLENQSVTGTLSATTTTALPITYQISTPPAHGTVVLTSASSGAFTYAPASNFSGADSFFFTVTDGQGISQPAKVTVTVTLVNHAPSFTAGPSQMVNQNTGALVVANWATNISAGPANESTQLLNFIVSNSNNALFSVQPALSANGTLSYATALNATGSASVTVLLHDDGGTANGGVDTSAPQTFTISVVVGIPVKITGGGTLSQGINFGFNVQPVKEGTNAKGFKGHLEYQDKGGTAAVQFKSTAMTSGYASDGHHGIFGGAGTLNGATGYTFTATVEDNARQGAGNDKFRLRIYNAGGTLIYDSNTRAVYPDSTLTGGKIKIHYDVDSFTTTSVQGAGSFLSGSLSFDIDVRTDAAGGYNGGGGIQFTDATNTYSLFSVSIDTLKSGSVVTVAGPALLNGTVVRLQTDWDTAKHTLQLRVWDAAGTLLSDSKAVQLTSGSCKLIAS